MGHNHFARWTDWNLRLYSLSNKIKHWSIYAYYIRYGLVIYSINKIGQIIYKEKPLNKLPQWQMKASKSLSKYSAVREKFCSAASLPFVSISVIQKSAVPFFVALSVFTFFTCKHYKMRMNKAWKSGRTRNKAYYRQSMVHNLVYYFACYLFKTLHVMTFRI